MDNAICTNEMEILQITMYHTLMIERCNLQDECNFVVCLYQSFDKCSIYLPNVCPEMDRLLKLEKLTRSVMFGMITFECREAIFSTVRRDVVACRLLFSYNFLSRTSRLGRVASC